jgi:hypothetical protein
MRILYYKCKIGGHNVALAPKKRSKVASISFSMNTTAVSYINWLLLVILLVGLVVLYKHFLF